MKSLIEQLWAAFQAKGWTTAQLLERSKLDCDLSSLNRKMRGRQKTSTEECQALAAALEVTIAWSPDADDPPVAAGAARKSRTA